MKFFRRRRINVAFSVALVRFKATIDACQHRAAHYLQRKSARLSRFYLYMWFAVFCLFAGTASIYVVIRSLTIGDASRQVTSISIPQHISQPKTKPKQNNAAAQYDHCERVRLLRQKIDSIRDENRGYYDSIVQVRPGLLDSIAMLENICKGRPN